jgi:hypothetical protein
VFFYSFQRSWTGATIALAKDHLNLPLCLSRSFQHCHWKHKQISVHRKLCTFSAIGHVMQRTFRKFKFASSCNLVDAISLGQRSSWRLWLNHCMSHHPVLCYHQDRSLKQVISLFSKKKIMSVEKVVDEANSLANTVHESSYRFPSCTIHPEFECAGNV